MYTGSVREVSVAADGVVAGESAREYVTKQDVQVDTVARHRLVHLINTVYDTTWSCTSLFSVALYLNLLPAFIVLTQKIIICDCAIQ